MCLFHDEPNFAANTHTSRCSSMLSNGMVAVRMSFTLKDWLDVICGLVTCCVSSSHPTPKSYMT